MPRFLLPTLALVACFLGLPLRAAEFSEIEQDLLNDIRLSQQELARTQEGITSERRDLNARLTALEREVESMREETAAARRAADENTLTLQTLQNRLAEWREQSLYQRYLLNEFVVQDNAGASTDEKSFAELLNEADGFLARVESDFTPHWQDGSVVLPGGDIRDASIFELGPVQWFVSADGSSSGLLEANTGLTANAGFTAIPRVVIEFDGAAADGLQSLRQNDNGLLTFDPTLNEALAIAGQQESLIQHIAKGGLWVVPILLFAAIALGITLFKSIQFLRLPSPYPELDQKLASIMSHPVPERRQALQELQTGSLKGMQQALLEIAMSTPPGQPRDDRLFSQLMKDKRSLENWLGAIAVIAATAPLLGLLGTVSGMIETFQLMTLFGAGDPEAVSSGISQALVTTELGLIVAIPSLLLHAILSRRVKAYYSELENAATQFSQLETGKAA